MEERIARGITGFRGTMRFIHVHVIGCGLWIVANLGVVLGVHTKPDERRRRRTHEARSAD